MAVVFAFGQFAEKEYKANTPEGRLASATRILESATSSINDKQGALMSLWEVQTTEAAVLLRKVAQEQTPPISTRAAEALFVRHDPVMVSLLESALIGSSESQSQLQKMGIPLDKFIDDVTDQKAIPAIVQMM